MSAGVMRFGADGILVTVDWELVSDADRRALISTQRFIRRNLPN